MLSDVLKPDEKKKFTSKHLKALRLFSEINNKKNKKISTNTYIQLKELGFQSQKHYILISKLVPIYGIAV